MMYLEMYFSFWEKNSQYSDTSEEQHTLTRKTGEWSKDFIEVTIIA
jgi:hypothetical protein